MTNILILSSNLEEAKQMRQYLLITLDDIQIDAKAIKPDEIDSVMVELYSLILIDIVLPDIESFSFCQSLRERTVVPILLVSETDNEAYIIRVLRVGISNLGKDKTKGKSKTNLFGDNDHIAAYKLNG